MLIVLADDVEAAWFYCIRTKIGPVVWCGGGAGSSTAVVKLITSDYYDLVFGVHRSLVPPEATSPHAIAFLLLRYAAKSLN